MLFGKVQKWLAPGFGDDGGDSDFLSKFSNDNGSGTNLVGVPEDNSGNPEPLDNRSIDDVLAQLPENDREILKPALLMQQDYTRKTQEVANIKREASQGVEQINSLLAELNELESDTISKSDLKNLFGKFGNQLTGQVDAVNQTVAQQSQVIQHQQQLIDDQRRQKVHEETVKEIREFEANHPYLSEDMILAVEEVTAAKIRNKEKGATLEKVLTEVFPEKILKQLKRDAVRTNAISRDQQTSHGSATGVSHQSVDTSDPAVRDKVGKDIIANAIDMVRGR